MFGQSHPGEQGHIFYYQFFDPDNDAFANLSIFEFNPSTFALVAPDLRLPGRLG